MSRKVLIVVASVLGMILLVGCGSVASFLVLNASPVGDAVRDAVGGKTYDQADADAALLTVDDLPGYRKESTNNQNGDNGLTPCGKALDMTTFGQAGTNRDAIFAKGETGPFVLHTVGLLNDDATLDPIRQVFKDCPNWTQGAGESYIATPASYGEYGDETYSVRLEIKSEGFTIVLGLVLIRKGNLLSAVTVAGFPAVDDAEITDIARKAADKLP